MKKTLAAVGLAVLSSTAFAQSYDSSNSQFNNTTDSSYQSGLGSDRRMDAQAQEESSTKPLASRGNRHMFEFNVGNTLAAALSFDKVKNRNTKSDNDVNYRLSGNYFYGVHRLIQAGVKFDFSNGVINDVDQERTIFEVGGYLNSQEDFSNAAFIGAFVGMGYNQTFGGREGSRRDDLRTAEVSVGKRMALTRWGANNISWSPEIALEYTNSTTDRQLDYLQSLQFRLLQFSVIF